MDLARADELGKLPPSENIPDLKKKIEEIRKKIDVKKKPVLNGKEIMDLLGLKQGPEVGRATNMLTDIEDDYFEKGKELTKDDAKKELLERFRKVAKSRGLRVVSFFLKDCTCLE